MTSDAFNPGNEPHNVPDWLTDAWQSGQNHPDRSNDQIISSIQQSLNKHMPSFGSWDYWFMASQLATLGWREVQRAYESQGQTDRVEDSDQPS